MVVTGGRVLCGEASVSGSKHSALLVLNMGLLPAAAASTFHNVPRIRDVEAFLDIARTLDVGVIEGEGNDITLDGSAMVNRPVPYRFTSRFHGSYLLLPVLASRFGCGVVGLPGGCRIDPLRFPTELGGLFEPFGYEFTLDVREMSMAAEKKWEHRELRQFDFTGVGARDITVFTKMAMILSGVHAGKTVIKKPFMGPEINDLAEVLRRMGAQVYGNGREVMSIEGCDHPCRVTYTVPPDLVEAVTLLACGVMTCGDVTVRNVPMSAMGAELAALSSLGAELTTMAGETLRGRRSKAFAHERHLSLTTGPYPALNTDTHPILAACLTQCHGTATIRETVWTNRFSYARHVREMGADVQVSDGSVIIRGPTRLHGAEVEGHDIRTCAALLLCGLAAEGRTVVKDCHHLHRGYEGFVEKLRLLGAVIDAG